MKNIILSVVALLSMSMTAMAQEENVPAGDRPQKMDRTEMIKKHTERMVSKYGLNAEQAAALQALNEKSMPQMRGPRPGGPKPEADKKSDAKACEKCEGKSCEKCDGKSCEKCDSKADAKDVKKEKKEGHKGGPDMEATMLSSRRS